MAPQFPIPTLPLALHGRGHAGQLHAADWFTALRCLNDAHGTNQIGLWYGIAIGSTGR